MKLKGANIIEISLIQLIFYVGVFLWNQHIGVLLSLSFAGISFAIVMLSYLVDWIEAGRLPPWYYPFMWISVICPIVVLVFFAAIGSASFQ